MPDIIIEIDEEAFKSLPLSGPFKRARIWSKREEELLLKYWPSKNHMMVAKLLKISPTTALKHYRELMEKENET